MSKNRARGETVGVFVGNNQCSRLRDCAGERVSFEWKDRRTVRVIVRLGYSEFSFKNSRYDKIMSREESFKAGNTLIVETNRVYCTSRCFSSFCCSNSYIHVLKNRTSDELYARLCSAKRCGFD